MADAPGNLGRGEAKGLALGKAEGLVAGEGIVLRKLLNLRFGPLPDDVLARIAAANTDQLEGWALRTLDARSLDEVFRG